MGSSSAALTLLLGVGSTGAEIADRLLSELREDPGFQARTADEDGALAALTLVPLLSESDNGEGRVEINRLFPGERQRVATAPVPEADVRSDYDFAGTVQRCFIHELERMLRSTSTSARGRATQVFVDVWLVGSVDEPLYTAALFPLVVTLRHTAAERFEALFRTLGPIINTNFQVHPIGISGNLKGLPRERRELLVGSLAALDRYSKSGFSQEGRRGPGGDVQQPVVARFYLIDGFTGSSMLGPQDQQRLVCSLLLLAIRTGLRHRPQLRELFRFRPGESDLLAVVTLAALEFPVTSYRNYCVLHAVAALVQYLSREPESFEQHSLLLDELLGPVLDELDIERVRSHFVEHGSGESFVELVDRQLPDFVSFTRSGPDDAPDWEARLPPSESILLPSEPPTSSSLYDQDTYLPELKRKHQPDELARFFDESWTGHPARELACRPPSPVPERFHPYLEQVNERGYLLIDQLTTRLRSALDRFLSTSSPPGRLASLLRMLEVDAAGGLVGTRRQLEERLRTSLPHAPDDKRYQVFADIFRDKIWSRLALPYLLLWGPALVLVAFFSLQHVIPGLDWAAEVIPALDVFYTDDPLKADPIRERVPQILVALLAALVVVLGPMWIANASVFGQLRAMLRSPLPYLSRLRHIQRMEAASEFGPEVGGDGDPVLVDVGKLSAEAAKLKKKAEKAEQRHGVLHREVEEMRKDFLLYWQSRVELNADLWTHRVVVHVGDSLTEELRRLYEFRDRLTSHGLEVQTRLRKLGDRHPSDRASALSIYPPEAPYHSLLLDDDAIPRFYEQYRTFGAEAEAAEILLRDHELLSQWRDPEGAMSDLDRLLEAAERLFPALMDGPFNLSAFAPTIDAQVDEFLSNLEGRLGGGMHFVHYASSDTEQDGFVDDTGVLLVAPEVAMRRLEAAASRAGLSQVRLVGGSGDPNRVYAIRIFRDISVASLASFLDLTVEPGPTAAKEDRQEGPGTDPWGLVRDLDLGGSSRRRD